jgi:phosphoribosylformylglycinamidine synthase
VLEVQNEFSIKLDELREAFTATLRNLFGGPAEIVPVETIAAQAAPPQPAAAPAKAAPQDATGSPAAEVVEVPGGPITPEPEQSDEPESKD